MKMYELPKIELPKLKSPKVRFPKIFGVLILVIFISSIFGFLAGIISVSYFYSEIRDYLSKLKIELPEPQNIEKEKIIERETVYQPQTSQEEAIIKAFKEVSPAVVSIIITKDLPILEEYYISPFEEF